MLSKRFHVDLKHSHPEVPLPQIELSQRARTLLFTGVAALVATARGIPSVTLGENGIMAINCPLTAGREAGFSTHTAHPDVLRLMGSLFTRVLERQVAVENPLLPMTKAEVVRELVSQGLANVVPLTHSCWVARRSTHCGTCVPCVVRRFSVEAAAAADVTYEFDCFDTPAVPGDTNYASVKDYLSFVNGITSQPDDDELCFNYMELNVEGGDTARRPIIETHRRWANEVLNVANRHPNLRTLL